MKTTFRSAGRNRWKLRWLFLALICLLLLGGGCRKSPPSVVLVSIDSLRYDDAVGSNRGRRIAPRLERLGREGVVFAQAYSTAPWTTPAMMAVMTGLAPAAHGVEEHDRALASEVPLLAERFKAAGYRTAAFVPEVTLRPEFGFSRGFDEYDLQSFGHQRLSSPTLIGKVLNKLEHWKGDPAPFFLWVHLWDPHYNYNPPPPFDQLFREGQPPASQDVQCLKWRPNVVSPDEVRFLRGQYRGEIAFTDRFLGDLLDYLKTQRLEERIVLAVVGDHGEAFEEHGWLGHTNRVDDEVLHVPLLLRWSGKLAPTRVEEAVSTERIGRTLLDLAGLPSAGFGAGLPLPVRGIAPAEAPNVVFAETVRQGCFSAVREGREKYILDHQGCRETLFDLATDPGEQRDVAANRPERVRHFRELLWRETERNARLAIPKAALPPAVAEQAEAQLRSLGYVGGSQSGPEKTGCPFAPGTGRRDTFGDTWTSACPENGVAVCLKKYIH